MLGVTVMRTETPLQNAWPDAFDVHIWRTLPWMMVWGGLHLGTLNLDKGYHFTMTKLAPRLNQSVHVVPARSE